MRFDAIRDLLRADIAAGLIPGAVVLVAHGGRTVWETAEGRRSPAGNDPMLANAIFRIFSMTKPVTAAGALLLVDRGDLDLNAPVRSILPAFSPPGVRRSDRIEPLLREPTVEDLLCHCAGLAYGDRSGDPRVRAQARSLDLGVNPRSLTSQQFIERLGAQPLSSQPGSVWEYGNASDVLGIVIETVSGQRLGDYLARCLFEPLEMNDTSFCVSQRNAGRVAEPFPADPETGQPISIPAQSFPAFVPPEMDVGGAGLLSTADDYMKFIRWLARSRDRDCIPSLSGALARRMTTDQLRGRGGAPLDPGQASMQSPGYGYGFGVGVRLAGTVANLPGSPGEFFWAGTAGTAFWVDPTNDLSVVFMAQAPGDIRLRYRRKLRELVYGNPNFP